jgi:hypothetical protein
VSWRAVFSDGPLAGPEHDRTFMGAWCSELYFFHLPDHGWVLVGTDQFNDRWPGQVRYVRNDERSSLTKDEHWQPGEDEGLAVFEVAP